MFAKNLSLLATKETAFLAAIASAGIVHAITKGCNTGNLTDCGCDSKPALQKYVEGVRCFFTFCGPYNEDPGEAMGSREFLMAMADSGI